jgi:hypothetical protein
MAEIVQSSCGGEGQRPPRPPSHVSMRRCPLLRRLLVNPSASGSPSHFAGQLPTLEAQPLVTFAQQVRSVSRSAPLPYRA